MIKRISMLISGSCLPKPGKCPGEPLIALSDQTDGSIYRLFEITFKPRSYPASIDEWTTLVIISGKFFVILRFSPQYSQRSNVMLDIKTTSAQWDLQAIFWNIEGTTPKIDLFLILCMKDNCRISTSKSIWLCRSYQHKWDKKIFTIFSLPTGGQYMLWPFITVEQHNTIIWGTLLLVQYKLKYIGQKGSREQQGIQCRNRNLQTLAELIFLDPNCELYFLNGVYTNVLCHRQ